MTKRKRIIMSVVAVMLIVLSIFAFVACNDEEETGLTFEEGTTAQDIIAMIDSGEIYSFTVGFNTNFEEMKDIYADEDGFVGYYEMIAHITSNYIKGSLWRTFSEGNGVIKDHVWDSFVVLNEDDGYTISIVYDYEYDDDYNVIGTDKEISVYKGVGQDSTVDVWFTGIKYALTNAISVDIQRDKIIIRQEDNHGGEGQDSFMHISPYIEIYNINNTKVKLPDEVKNYKELANDSQDE